MGPRTESSAVLASTAHAAAGTTPWWWMGQRRTPHPVPADGDQAATRVRRCATRYQAWGRRTAAVTRGCAAARAAAGWSSRPTASRGQAASGCDADAGAATRTDTGRRREERQHARAGKPAGQTAAERSVASHIAGPAASSTPSAGTGGSATTREPPVDRTARPGHAARPGVGDTPAVDARPREPRRWGRRRARRWDGWWSWRWSCRGARGWTGWWRSSVTNAAVMTGGLPGGLR